MWVFVAAAVLAQLVAAAVDIASIPRESSSNIVPRAYIVELTSGTHLKRGFDSPHAELYHDLARRGALWEVTREYAGDIMTGAALKLGSDADLLKLAQATGVQAIMPVYTHLIPSPIDPYIPSGPSDPRVQRTDTLSTHLMTGVDKLQAQGLLGQGIKIGIIDTGIDYTHPALGGKFGPGNKVIGGYDFVGDAYTGSSGPAPVPDNDPLDQCNGHGTHVAGIIGADPANPYNISGVAYRSSLNAYRIFGCTGGVSDDIIIAALIRAYNDGNDIINLSLGDAEGWTEAVTGVIASRIADKGRIVVAAAGNDGQYGSWYASSPGTGLNVISVGSVDNTVVNVQNATLSNGDTIPYFSFLPLPFPANIPIYATTADIKNAADACQALPATTPDLSNRLVLIRRGGCAFTTKMNNAAAKGGRYFFISDNVDKDLSGIDVGNFSAALISQKDGNYLRQKAIPANLTISFPDASFAYPVSTGGLMSAFSTYGPTNDLYLKPAISAPGGNILSTNPVALGSYKIDSGTSMAAPFVAGSAALLLQARGKTAGVIQAAKTMFENTALPVRAAPGNSSTFDTTGRQGAGLVQVYDAIRGTGSMTPSELLLNDTASFKRFHTVTIRNTGRKPVTYRLTHVPAGTANTISGIENKLTVSLADNPAKASITPSKLTVLPGLSAIFSVSFTPPTGLDASAFPVYSGFIQATGSDGSTLHSTYLGVAAPIKSMRVVDNTTAFFGVKLPLVTDKSGSPINGPTTFTMQGADFPLVVYRLVAGSPNVRLDLITAQTNVSTNLRRFVALPSHEEPESKANGHVKHILPFAAPAKRAILDWLIPSRSKTTAGSFAAVPTLGVLYQEDYVGRNSRDPAANKNGYNSFKVATFANGTTIPDGSYKILLRALKITGDRTKEEDYEVWTSPQVDIKRA